MKAAVVECLGKPPVFGEFRDPVCASDDVLITVQAAALSNLVRLKAAGTHYSGVPETPFVPGVDGVGVSDDGQPLYFFSPPVPFGAMAERVAVARKQTVTLPALIDPVKAAALANPGMSSVAALRYRARIEPGQAVLVNGATGVSGRLAVQIAKRLGASRVIATGRNKEVLDQLRQWGADEVITLSEDRADLENAFATLLTKTEVDIVLDYIWGPSMECLLAAVGKTIHDDHPLRIVQIGSMSAQTICLPASVMRSTGVTLMGSGIGSVSTADLLRSIEDVFQLEASQPLDIAFESVALNEVEARWSAPSPKRMVFTP